MAENVFRENEYDGLADYLKENGIHTVHATNGSFSRGNEEKPWQVAATTLAAFECARDQRMPEDAQGHAFIVCVNTPESDIRDYKHNPDTTPGEQARLDLFLPHMEAQFEGDVPVVVAFYDKSAVQVYDKLFEAGIEVADEYKYHWGIGKADPHVTHKNTQAVCHPYADATKPTNAGRGIWDKKEGLTQDERMERHGSPNAEEKHEAKGNVLIVNLHELGYLSADDKPLFFVKQSVVIPGLDDDNSGVPTLGMP